MEKKINSGVVRTGETDIKLHLIDSFLNHPYHVFDDEDMTELAASIKANGLLNPIIVRSKADGRYELISGHRRKRAYEILKINPFVYLHSDNDIQKLVTNIFKNTTPKGSKSQDPFWDQAAMMLLLAFVFYLHYEAPPEEQNFPMVMEMIRSGEVK